MGLLDRNTAHVLAVNDTVDVMPDFFTQLAGTTRGKLMELDPPEIWRTYPIGTGKNKDVKLPNTHRGGIVQLGNLPVRYPLESLTFVPKKRGKTQP